MSLHNGAQPNPLSHMKILFLHGWHSVPGGVKPSSLIAQGHLVLNPALDDDDFASAVRTAQAAYDSQTPDVIVGSSRGAAVALHLHSARTPLVLLCPAWKNYGGHRPLKANSLILHSRQDSVIPFSDSEELVRSSGLPPEILLEVGRDHRLADPESLSVLHWACTLLASGQHLPALDEDSQFAPDSADPRNALAHQEASYVCDACGEEIVIPLDLTEGTSQTYVEDCPVCCRANTIHVRMDDDGQAHVHADPEQDP